MRPFYRGESDWGMYSRTTEFPEIRAKTTRPRKKSVATLPPGTSRRTWSRQSVTSIPDCVSFPLPTSSLPLPGRRLYFWLLRVCLCRVFLSLRFQSGIGRGRRGGGVVRFSYLPLFVRSAMRRTLRHGNKKTETPACGFSFCERERYRSLLKVAGF